MLYELRITLKTIRDEGLGSFVNKIRVYFGDRSAAKTILSTKRPDPTPEAIVDFLWNAAGGMLEPVQSKPELADLLAWIKNRPAPKAILEIGTARGGTLFTWCRLAAPEATLISVDLPFGIHGGGYPPWKVNFYRQFAQPNQKIHLLRGDSHDPNMLEDVKKLIPPGGLDFLFIDGDHTYEGVKSDYVMYSPLVKSGGTIIFHDICVHLPEYNCHVDKFWNEVKQGREYWEFIEKADQGSYGIGVTLAK